MLLLHILHKQHVTDIIPRTAGDHIKHVKCQTTTIPYQLRVLFGSLRTYKEHIQHNYLSGCSNLPNSVSKRGSNYLLLFSPFSSFCLCFVSALAHELQTSSLIKSDQWGIGRMLRRTQLTNLACQRQRKSKGWVEERWGYKGKAVSASSGTSCAWALCTQPCTNNRWGFFSTFLFNGSGFDFSFLLSCLQLSGVCWTPEMRQSLVSGIVFLSTNVPQFPTVFWLKTC